MDTTKLFMEKLAASQPALFAGVAALLPFRPQDVDDVVQDVNLEMIRLASRWDPSRPFRPWMFGVARNTVRNFLRRRVHTRIVFDSDLTVKLAELLASETDTQEPSTDLARLAACRSKLSERAARLIALRYDKGLTVREIAKTTGEDATSVNTALTYARRKLAGCMKRACDLDTRETPFAIPVLEKLLSGDEKPSQALADELVDALASSAEAAAVYLEEMQVHQLLARRFVEKSRPKTLRRRIALGAFFATCAAAATWFALRASTVPLPEKTPAILAPSTEHATQETRTMKTPASLAAVASIAATTASAQLPDNVVYQNDFSTRQSAETIPTDAWAVMPYHEGQLANAQYASPFGDTSMQDNWLRGSNNGAAPSRVVDDGGNMVAAFCGTENLHGIAKQRLGNVFKTGTIHAQFDMRAPANWTKWGNSYGTYFAIGGETFFSPETGTDYASYRFASVGLADQARKFLEHTADGTAKHTGANNTSWYRFTMTLDLDTKLWGWKVYDMGEEHPTMQTETPGSADFERGNLSFVHDASEGVSAIGFFAYSPDGGNEATDLSQSCLLDNITIAHDGELFYVNDFSSRRSRSLMGTGKVAEYTADCVSTNTVGGEVYSTGNLIAAQQGNANYLQPIGVDGWRRQNGNGGAMITIASDSNNQCAQFANTGTFGIGVHKIGRKAASGKVTLRTDVLWTTWHNTTYGSLNIYLAGEDFYDKIWSQSSNTRFAQFAVQSANHPQINGTTDDTVALDANTWHRVKIVADIDKQTCDVTVCKLGASHPALNSADGEIVWQTSVASMNDVKELATIGIGGYWGAKILFDNIEVLFNDESVYKCDFSSRTVVCDEKECPVVTGTLNKNPDGLDGWRRLGKSTRRAVAQDGALFFTGSGNSLNAIATQFASPIEGEKSVVQFDVAAPGSFSSASGSAQLLVGGELLREGSLNSESDVAFAEQYAVIAGFVADGNSVRFAANTEVSEAVAEGGKVYRWTLELVPSKNIANVKATDIASGEVSVQWQGIPFHRTTAQLGGLSVIAIAETATVGSVLEPKRQVKWSNIRVTRIPNGTVIMLI